MFDFEFKESYNADDLLRIMRMLRAPGGCPWDSAQTHQSIKKNLIEETYEVVEAINKDDKALLCEELGDLLMQVVFHSVMEEEEGNFDFDKVSDGICKKLIERHPHIFGDVSVGGVDDVLTNWDAIKMRTKGQKKTSDSMKSVPRELPALMRAEKIQKKAADAGFDWDDASGAIDKLCEELGGGEEPTGPDPSGPDPSGPKSPQTGLDITSAEGGTGLSSQKEGTVFLAGNPSLMTEKQSNGGLYALSAILIFTAGTCACRLCKKKKAE